ncbi:MAG: mannose-1-phosphate guanylyltransferase/mannose-6-phosphate isomerase [Gammaproteobacteria bacterium]|nr:mannose-1-phosphate guanylyltransferase/mannose-6-phosphate isomerase [Gammaproteobacteria bacterium]
MNIVPVILSGGAGSRLWPVSRELYPKQLVKLLGEKSLLQQTLLRCEKLKAENKSISNPVIVCNEQHRFLVAQQASEVGVSLGAIILEPVGRNTAPALTLAAQYIEQKVSSSLMIVWPADHAIKNEEQFIKDTLDCCRSISLSDNIGVFGIRPTVPHEGYGYIEVAEVDSNVTLQEVKSFKEKPEKKLAEQYLKSGNYFWNSGTFVISSVNWCRAIKTFNKEIAGSCEKAIANAQQDLDFVRVNKEDFAASPSDSIDYAVIEQVEQLEAIGVSIKVKPLDCGWTDLGAWPSVSDYLEHDDHQNVTQGDVVLENVRNTFVHSSERFVAAVGVEDLVIVETPDAVLVASKHEAQNVKKVVEKLKQSGREEHLVHRKVFRPWGNYETVDYGSRYQVKRIVVNPGARLSLQMHHHRAEHWIVVHGTAEVTCDEKTFLMSENESTYIPVGSKHRLANPGKFPLELIEVQSGAYLGEDDIVRFDDIYGRANESVKP